MCVERRLDRVPHRAEVVLVEHVGPPLDGSVFQFAGIVPGEVSTAVADELHRPVGFVARPVDHPREVADERREHPLALLEGLLGAVLRDGALDAIGQQRVLVGGAALLEVLGHAGGDGFARDLLAPLAGEEDERETRIPLADGLEEVQPVHPRHIVVADDTVDRSGRESVEPVARAGLGEDLEPVVVFLQVESRRLGQTRVVVDVQDPDRFPARTAHVRGISAPINKSHTDTYQKR